MLVLIIVELLFDKMCVLFAIVCLTIKYTKMGNLT